MNVLILGDGGDELAWARAVEGHPDFTLWAAYPGFKELADLPTSPVDLDDALALAGVDLVVVGGEPKFRAEALRRVAVEGLPTICLHPPGPNADPYYQVALSEAETGSIVVPDLPIRLHPGFLKLKRALDQADLGAFREVRHEVSVDDHEGSSNLVLEVFPTAVDPVRALIGEIDTVTATGEPLDGPPTQSLLVQVRSAQAKRAEVRITAGGESPARLTLIGSEGTIVLEYDPSFETNARIITRVGGVESEVDLPAFNPYDAILRVLVRAMEASSPPNPSLIDGTRAMELAEASARSLRRHRTIDLHYEEVSEAGNFKTVMTSVGCVGLWGVLLALPIALVGPAFGAPWTIYIAWLIPPFLVLFILLQSLKMAIKPKLDGSSKRNPTVKPEMLDVES